MNVPSLSASSIKTTAIAPTIRSTRKALVGTAILELAPQPLHRQIQAFAEVAQAIGCRQIKILPLLLLPGVHVMEDIPAEVAIARQAIGDAGFLQMCPYLGSHPALKTLLVEQTAIPQTATNILLAHGSRRVGGNQPVEAIAADLNALVAYWAIPPSLETRVEQLVQAGCREIGILPYFLFAGGITEAIAEKVSVLSECFPTVQFHLANPLGATDKLAMLVIEQCTFS